MALTPKQQQFLDDYIRKHAVKGKGKRKRADGFAELRQQAVKALAAIPTSVQDRANLDAAMDAADQLGEALKFDRAAAALKQLLRDIAQSAAAHDPTDDIAALRVRVDTALNCRNNLNTNLPNVLKFSGPDHAGLLQLGRPVDEATDLPDRARVGDDTWAGAVLQLVRQRSADLAQLADRLRNARTAVDQVRNTTRQAAADVQAAELFATDIFKGCRSPQQRDQVSQEMARMRSSLIEHAAYAALLNGKTLSANNVGSAYDDAYAALEPLVSPMKIKLESLRSQAEAIVLQRRPADAGPDAANKHAGNLQLAVEELQDLLLGIPNLPPGKPTRAKPKVFDQTAVLAGIKLGAGALADSPQAVPETDKDFKETATVARNLLKKELEQRKLAVDSDEIFDLTMLSAADFGNNYARAQGWNMKKLTAGQQSMMQAVGAGMFEHACTLCTNRLDANTKTFKMGKESYGKPKLLAKGGMGAVYRYESETRPGQFIVLKSLLDQDPTARAAMANELRGHRHLMQGQGDMSALGAKNVMGLHGAVVGDDGSLHMAMEVVSGGDMEDNRHALDVASDLGAIPEEVRNLVTQARMKQAVEGLVFMREQNLVHFDIKGANFMLTEDGTVKVADFGSAGMGSDTDGKRQVGIENVGTPGYSPDTKVKEEVGSSYDLYALGKVFETAHMKAPGPQQAKKGVVGHKPLTGALGRVVDSMTEADAAQRGPLEAVLTSSYLQGVDEVDPEALHKVSVASIAYGKALKAEGQQVCASLPDTLLDLAALRLRIKRADVGFTAVAGTIRMVLDESQLEMTKLRAAQSSAKNDEERHDINAQLGDLQDKIATHKGYLARFGQSAECKKLAAQMRQLSDELLRPQDKPSPEKAAEFLAMLQGSVKSTGEFCAAVSLRSYAGILRGWGADPDHVRQLAKLYQADITVRNGKALDMLKDGHDSIQELMNSVTDSKAKVTLVEGFTRMVRSLRMQYQASSSSQTV